jgi:cellulose synthase/poly-beta-1,6-N-acetylglucosamine synthase-like glycosyltransferase
VRFVSLVSATVLALLFARRALFALASLLPDPLAAEGDDEPGVVLLVVANDEAPTLGRLLATIERLDWRHDRLHIVLVDDGSADGTWEVMAEWADAKDYARAVRLALRVGKSEALNVALSGAPPGDVVVVCDADLRLAPDYLRRLVPAFGDPEVGAAAAFVTSANADAGVIARYSALETWVHQLVTGAGKHRLGLNPATFAGSAYRRTALEAIGGFPGRNAGDDVGATASLTRAGWRTCFVPAARADHVLAARVSDYWRQHIRWSRNVFEAGLAKGANGSRATRRRRLELALAAVGYGDRLAFAGVLALATSRRISPAVPASYAGLRLFETVVAVVKAGETRRLPAYVAAAALVLPLDVAASVTGLVALRWLGPAAWARARRSQASIAFE